MAHVTQAAPDTSQDGAVLAAVMKGLCADAALHPGAYRSYRIVPDRTGGIEFDSMPKNIDPAAFRSLRRRNAQPHSLPVIPVCPAYQRVPDADIRAAASGHGQHRWPYSWGSIHQDFPGADGISRLSLPGYSADGRMAIVLVGFDCGALCGNGEYWIVRRVHGRWVKTKRVPGWVE